MLERAEPIELYDLIYDANDLERDGLSGKPRPYVRAAELVGVAPDRAAFVEDGVAAARAGGFRLVIGIDRGVGGEALRRAGADVVVSDLAQLAPTPP